MPEILADAYLLFTFVIKQALIDKSLSSACSILFLMTRSEKLKSGDRDMFKFYTSQCRYKGKWHEGLYIRRLTELAALFIP